MSSAPKLRRIWTELLCAIQFLTRVPVPSQMHEEDALARAVKFFPLVGLLIGASAALLHSLLAPHLSRLIAALLVLVYLVCVTGCLHEDGLTDAADGFGGGWSPEQALAIMRDSRIGSYGAVALTLSLLARCLLISSLPLAQAAQYLIAAHVLCRWTTLPLSFYLPPARPQSPTQTDARSDGQGARVAQLTTRGALIAGTSFSFAIVAVLLRSRAVMPLLTAAGGTLLSALYYRRRIGGVTGDCFGATNQLTEIAVYFCGAWTV